MDKYISQLENLIQELYLNAQTWSDCDGAYVMCRNCGQWSDEAMTISHFEWCPVGDAKSLVEQLQKEKLQEC